MAKKRFPWGRFYVGLATLVAVVLAVGFVLTYLGVNIFPVMGITESQ